ncbi:MAG TPA: BlaI/MecI/CopY family transcriptional regulator [Thermoanaerobaculia bacterium]|nr:BlaI/MecI/CopY family transcriptional regulator [Thermoanaerobaculia bacterium]
MVPPRIAVFIGSSGEASTLRRSGSEEGALTYDEQGNRYLYSPAVARKDAIRAEGRSFVERVFGGEAALALLHFARQADLPAEEVEELRRLIEGREEG